MNFTSLTASATRGGPTSLTWAIAGNGQTGYTIQRAENITFSGNTLRTFTVGNVTTYSDSTVQRGRTYFYRIAPTNPFGQGAWSNVLSVTTIA